MLNKPLLKQSFKSTRFLWFAITFSMAGMLAQFIFLDFGGEMVSMIYYQMTAIVLSGIYIMVSANKLIAVQVDRGSMAYVLCNPIMTIGKPTVSDVSSFSPVSHRACHFHGTRRSNK